MQRLIAVEGKISGALAAVFPALATAACVRRPSASVGIQIDVPNTRRPRMPARTATLWPPMVRTAPDLPGVWRTGSCSRVGWGEVSKSSAVLYRTLIYFAASDPRPFR